MDLGFYFPSLADDSTTKNLDFIVYNNISFLLNIEQKFLTNSSVSMTMSISP